MCGYENQMQPMSWKNTVMLAGGACVCVCVCVLLLLVVIVVLGE